MMRIPISTVFTHAQHCGEQRRWRAETPTTTIDVFAVASVGRNGLTVSDKIAPVSSFLGGHIRRAVSIPRTLAFRSRFFSVSQPNNCCCALRRFAFQSANCALRIIRKQQSASDMRLKSFEITRAQKCVPDARCVHSVCVAAAHARVTLGTTAPTASMRPSIAIQPLALKVVGVVEKQSQSTARWTRTQCISINDNDGGILHFASNSHPHRS